ncbi:MAG: hypothetical protein U1F53_17905 [Burkholderiaceae bacterium]
MLISDKLILVELHKTGSARLKKLLGDLVGGETRAKHAAYSDELASMGKPVVGYVCNPLTWYLAQWQLGCSGKGDIHKRLTDETKWDLLKSKRSALQTKEGSRPGAKALPEGWNAERAKSFWYADAENVDAFREWLQAVMAERGLRRLVEHGYNNSPVSHMAGLMTYHFFLMFVRDAENMERSVDSMDALKALHAKARITQHFVRSEAVSADLLAVLEAVGVKLTAEQRTAIDALKERSNDAVLRRFYDAPSLRLVAKREAFLNELFGYGPPAAKAGRKAPADAPAPGEAVVKLSKAEKEQKRQARAERQAAKPAKAGGKPAADKPAKAEKAAKPQADKAPKPEKVKRVKNKPADDDVIDNDE